MFAVNARLRARNTKWASHLGGVMLVLAAVAAVLVAGLFGIRSAGQALFGGNKDYALTNLVIKCESQDLKAQIAAEAMLTAGTNIFSVPIRALQSRLAKKDRIKSVSIIRRLPHELEIAVKERVAVARLGNPRDLCRTLVVDDEGVVFARDRNLPLIAGYGELKIMPGDRLKDRLGNALVLLSFCSMSPVGQSFRIASIGIEKEYLDVRLIDGPRILLGMNADITDPEVQRKELETRLKISRLFMKRYEQEGVALQVLDQRQDDPNQAAGAPRLDRRS